MRLYPNQIEAIQRVIQKVIHESLTTDSAVQHELKTNTKWGAKDRRNFAEASYDIIRYYELLLGINPDKTQLIDTYLQVFVANDKNIDEIIKLYPTLTESQQLSVPEAFLTIFQKEHPHAKESIASMQRSGSIYLRVNTSLIPYAEFQASLQKAEIPFEAISEVTYEGETFPLHAIKLFENTHKHREFFDKQTPYYEIQDIGSQLLTQWMDLSQAKTIIEACAGQGGKTTHILDQTNMSKPLLIAFDTSNKKLEHLTERIAKWKNHKVVIDKFQQSKLEKYENIADVLTIDAPCTGSGTLKRQADIKFRIDEESIQQKIASQREIIEQFNPMLKSGGSLYYTTCSLFQSENQAQATFIESLGYQKAGERLLDPRLYAGDGFYWAKFVKN